MKNLFWFVLGLAGGVVVAHFVNRDPRGHEVLAQVDARITEFTDRIGAAYREQEARFAGPLSDVRDAAATAFETAKDAAASAVDTAKDAASSTLAAAKDAVTDATSGTTETEEAAADGPPATAAPADAAPQTPRTSD